jgi:hypothetical protein
VTNSPESRRHPGLSGATTQAFPPTAGMPGPGHRPGPDLRSIPLVAAVLALLLAVLGVVVATIALRRGNEATTLARSAHQQAVPPASEPSAAEPTPALGGAQPTDQPTAALPEGITPSAQFTVAYPEQSLRIASRECDSEEATQVDLDEPRVTGTATEDAELGYAGCSPGSIGSELAFAPAPGPDATPADCIEAIRTNPGQSPVAASVDLSLCLLTSPATPEDQPKLVLLTVDSIDQDDRGGVLTVTAEAWNVRP